MESVETMILDICFDFSALLIVYAIKGSLEKSLILVNDNRIKKLLDMVFTLQSPVAPVYLWMTERIDKDEIYNMCENCSVDNILEDMIYIKPNSSLIPFL